MGDPKYSLESIPAERRHTARIAQNAAGIAQRSRAIDAFVEDPLRDPLLTPGGASVSMNAYEPFKSPAQETPT
jgi:hypothetical protein